MSKWQKFNLQKYHEKSLIDGVIQVIKLYNTNGIKLDSLLVSDETFEAIMQEGYVVTINSITLDTIDRELLFFNTILRNIITTNTQQTQDMTIKEFYANLNKYGALTWKTRKPR